MIPLSPLIFCTLAAVSHLPGTTLTAALAPGQDQEAPSDQVELMGVPTSLNYNYVQATVGEQKVDGFLPDGDSVHFGLSFAITETIFLRSSYQDSDFDFEGEPLVEIDLFRAGLGARAGVAEAVDLYSIVSYVEASSTLNLGGLGVISAATDGYSISAGARIRLGARVELDLEYEHLDFGQGLDDSMHSAEATFMITDRIGLQAEYLGADGSSSIMGGLRFYL